MKTEDFWAHSENEAGRPHLLEGHLKKTAEMAGYFAKNIGTERIGYLLGLFHDTGKFSNDFQDYLRSNNIQMGPDHKRAGSQKIAGVAHFLGFIIAGHHSGMPDKNKFKDFVSNGPKINAEVFERFEKIIKFEPPKNIQELLPDFLFQGSESEQKRQIEFFVRMLYSCLVDADFLDTEAHFNPKISKIRENYSNIRCLWNYFKQSQNELLENADDSEVNRWRKQIYDDCLNASEQSPGLFSLTVPTGGGKTRSGMGFAIKHALKNDMDRVIVVIPYTSIIEQNVDVYREIFGLDNVVEHHSSLKPKNETEKNRLLSENWDAPVIVTTTVQFFNSLFSNRPSSCRKLHNIANSVVILDEVQTLPPHYIEPILDGLNELTSHYNTSIVFSTATQPVFEKRPNFPGLEGIREIIREPEEVYEALKRTRFHVNLEEEQPVENIIEQISDKSQILAIFNTVALAQEIFVEVRDRCGVGTFHLSAGLCGAHRRDVLEKVNRRLDKGKSCRLISTQCVEAGVDFDFPVVLRAIAPMDSMAQAAGRCNREGKQNWGEVFIVEPEEHKLPPGAYERGTDTAKMFISNGTDWHDPNLYREYFQKFYSVNTLDKQIKDGQATEKLQAAREKWKFKTVADNFRLIDQASLPVIVPYGEAEQILKNTHPDHLGRDFFRKIQPYLVTLYPNKLEKACEKGLCAPYSEEYGLYRWTGKYDPESGLSFEDRGVLIG